jgi:histidine ammonia-lyase
VSYSKQLCTPASADNADSSNGQEDHVSMGANGALQMWRVLDHAEQVLAIEAMCAAQASDLRGDEHAMAPALRELQNAFRKHVPFLERDVVMAPLMASAAAWIRGEAPTEKADLRDAQS